LADAVAYAEKIIKPNLIIDFATLTGACMVALGEDIAGVFGNNDREVKRFMECTKQEGEDAWTMPYYRPYLDLMKSDVADLKNVSGKGYGGAITAALFIGEFVSKTKWIHVDIAGPAHNSGRIRGTVGKGGTGWGVLSIINLLQTGA
jgi:leucyl aminopeptidase